MNGSDFNADVLDTLEALRVAYHLVGRGAARAYGVPAGDGPLELVARLAEEQAEDLAVSLPAHLAVDPAGARRRVADGEPFTITGAGGVATIYPLKLHDDHAQSVFKRRNFRAAAPGERPRWAAAPEDVLLGLLQAGDPEMAAALARVQAGRLRLPYLDKWATRLDVETSWAQVRPALLSENETEEKS